MIKRLGGYLTLRTGAAPAASAQLERDGYAVLPGVLEAELIARLTREIEEAFASLPPERGRPDRDEFRYEMLNRSAACQEAVGHPALLAAIEPLLGEDCHVIANTAWRNPPSFGGGPWHCDAGPHVPRPEGVPWDERIPYPVFAIGTHLYLRDCPLACGPTAVIPGSHRSGRLPPFERLNDAARSATRGAEPSRSRRAPGTSRCSFRTPGTAACPPCPAAAAACSSRRTTRAATSRSASAPRPTRTSSRAPRSRASARRARRSCSGCTTRSSTTADRRRG
jgi:hypothetical protein